MDQNQLRPSGNAAETLLQNLNPWSDEERRLVKEFEAFIPEFSAACSAYYDCPTHSGGEKTYQVTSIVTWGYVIAEKDLARVLTAEYRVGQMMKAIR